MDKVTGYLIDLLSSVLKDAPLKKPPEGVTPQDIFTAAKRHAVEGMVFYAVKKILPPQSGAYKLFEKANILAVTQGETMNYEVRQALAEIRNAGIKVMPIKGYYYKNMYPEASMRQMSDVDVLVEKDKMTEAEEILKGLGYEIQVEADHHDECIKRPFTKIELHRGFVGKHEKKMYAYYKNPWDFAKETDDDGNYRMNLEDHYVFLIAHTAKHYRFAGSGIRPVMDIWLYNHNYGEKLDRKYIDKQLEELEMLKFERNMKRLGAVWFDDALPDEFTDRLSDYTMAVGVYGAVENKEVLKEIRESGKTKSKGIFAVKSLFYLVFPRLADMQRRYPVLLEKPYLLPFYHVKRHINLIFKNRSHSLERIDEIKNKDMSKKVEIGDFYTEIGL